MALDVYVGSLTRYYSGDWENAAEKIARERGVSYRVASPDDPKDRVRDADRIRPVILAWRRKLGEALGDRVPAGLDWDESHAAPYFSDRAGWDGFGSLVLWAAYSEHPSLRRPAELPEEWDDDPALVRSNADGFTSRYGHLVRNVERWLPGSFGVTFEAEDASGRKAVIGSAAMLSRQLVELNGATWKATDGAVAAWRRRPLDDNADLEQRAQFGFAVLSALARLANDNNLPMKLDY
jgi:hypothetical protein